MPKRTAQESLSGPASKKRKETAEKIDRKSVPAASEGVKAGPVTHMPFLTFEHDFVWRQRRSTFETQQNMVHFADYFAEAKRLIEWPRNRDNRPILISLTKVTEAKQTWALECFDKKEESKAFFSATIQGKKMQRLAPASFSPHWNPVDIQDLEEFFKFLFKISEKKNQVKKTTAEKPFTEEEFKTFIATYQQRNISTRMLLLHNSLSSKKIAVYTQHTDAKKFVHTLRVEFSPLHKSPNNSDGINSPYKSWVLSEEELINRQYPQHKDAILEYRTQLGRGTLDHYWVQIFDTQAPKAVMTVRFTNNGQAGEIYDVSKREGSSLSGNEILKFYFDKLQPFLQIQIMYLCDKSRIDCGDTEIPLRLLRKLATGETLYEPYGFKMFDCKNMRAGWNEHRSLSQDVKQYEKSLAHLKNLPMSEMVLHYQDNQKNAAAEKAKREALVVELSPNYKPDSDEFTDFKKTFSDSPVPVLSSDELKKLSERKQTFGDFCAEVHKDRSSTQILLKIFLALIDADLRRFHCSDLILDDWGDEFGRKKELDMAAQTQAVGLSGDFAKLFHWRSYVAVNPKAPAVAVENAVNATPMLKVSS